MSFGSGDLGMGVRFTLIDNFSDNADAVASGMLSLEGIVNKVGAKTFILNEISRGIDNVNNALAGITGPGQIFDKNLQELSAIAGITGDKLDNIGDKALGLSVKFGSDASNGVNSFKNVLSKLGPEIADNATALQGMGDSIFTLSKTMENDLAGATGALTTSMNIYAGTMTDPVEMTTEMARQMNAMAAAAQVGSAEVVDIAASIKTGGLAAKNAGASFEELNTLIQIMGKGAVYGSEAGVALRNTLSIMSQGKYMPKQAREGLIAAGVDIQKLADVTIPVKDRLLELQKIYHDGALVTEVFGRENKNAFMVLMENIGKFDEWNAAITGTTSGYDQAAIVMSSYSEKMARLNARLESYKIAIFEATKAALPYIQTGLMMLQGMVNLAPAAIMASEGLKALRASQFMTTVATSGLTAAFHAQAIAAWKALVPLLPYIAAAAAIGAVFYGAYKGIQLFRDLMDGKPKEDGLLGFLQKIGGVITGIIQIWQTWNGETYMLTDQMREALEKAGILQFVLDLGTWVVRLKAMFGGMADVFSATFNVIGQVLSGIGDGINWLFNLFGNDLKIKKSSESIEDWAASGKVLAGAILGLIAMAITPLIVSMASLAISVIAATWPIIVIAAAVLGLIWLFNNWDMVTAVVSDSMGKMWDSVLAKGEELWDWFVGLHVRFANWGAGLVSSIGEGISGAWDSLISLMLDLIRELPFAGQIMDLFGIGGGTLAIAGTPAASNPANIGRTIAETKAVQSNQRPTIIDKSTVTTEQINLAVTLDTDVIATAVKKADQFDNDRR